MHQPDVADNALLVRPTRLTSWYTDVARRYVADLSDALAEIDVAALGGVAQSIVDAIRGGNTVYIAGNGGSAAAASHMASDWSAAAAGSGSPTPVIGLADNLARLTALGNDTGFDQIFSLQLAETGRAGDLLVLLSVSGSSPNLVNAAKTARRAGMGCVGFFGNAGAAARWCDDWVLLGRGDYGLAEDLHVCVNHVVVRALRDGAAQRYLPANGTGGPR